MRTAIETCPVDCIHYVDWPELVRLEKEREGIDINFKAKLVGNDHDNAVNGMQVCMYACINRRRPGHTEPPARPTRKRLKCKSTGRVSFVCMYFVCK